MIPKTAILVFANSAQEELQHKPMLGGKALFTELNNRILSIVKSTGIPFFVFSEKNQKGSSFAERFVHAMQSTYNKGYENVIAIGNDTPQLTKQHILKSDQYLTHKKFVLGPSADGGFYLLGLHRSKFNKERFLTLPWQSKNLAKSIIASFLKNSEEECVKLPVLFDIDTTYDLKTIKKYAHFLWRRLIKILNILCNTILEVSGYHFYSKEFLYHQSSFNKGSPQLQILEI